VLDHDGQMTEYIETTIKDVEIANKLTHALLNRSLDELPSQTRNLLKMLGSWVDEECTKQGIDRSSFHFTRRQMRQAIGCGQTQLRLHLKRLQDMEYVVVHRADRGCCYELCHAYGEGVDWIPAHCVADVGVEAGHIGVMSG
jgi:hypothetical protein